MHNTLNTIRSTLFTLLMVSGTCDTAIAAPRLYDVEVIIFSHNNPSDQGESRHTADSNAGRTTGNFPASQFTALSSSHHKLEPVRYSLRKSSGYAVLYHRAWRQPAYSQSNAAGYAVHSSSADSRNSIDGTIRLVRGRYLHLNVDLLFMKTAERAAGHYSDDPGSTPAYRLTEKRRIKSKELHYFDHSQFGVLALVTPYQSPEAEVLTSDVPTAVNNGEKLQPASE